MSKRKSFKILPRHTAKGDVVRVFEKAIKRQVDKRKNFMMAKSVKAKQNKENECEN